MAVFLHVYAVLFPLAYFYASLYSIIGSLQVKVYAIIRYAHESACIQIRVCMNLWLGGGGQKRVDPFG